MRLVIVPGPGSDPSQFQPNIFELPYNSSHTILRIGRHTSNDIILPDASVSRQHTEIEVQADGLVVRDLGSSNGTYINRKRLEPQVSSLLRPGQELRIGNIITVLEAPVGAGTPPTQLNSAPPYPATPSISDPAYVPAEPAPVYYAPEAAQAPRPVAARRPKAKGRSEPNWFVVGILLGLIILGLAVLGFLLFQLLSPNPNASNLTLPSNVFASPANTENLLGVSMARPSEWQKAEPVKGVQFTFNKPGSPTTLITVEKPPGPTLANPNLTPELALRQYLANVQANSQNYRVLAGPSPTRLLDATPAYFARVAFSTTGQPALTNYTVNALTFKCGNTLYFASTAAEGKDYLGSTQQDLEAAIANFKC